MAIANIWRNRLSLFGLAVHGLALIIVIYTPLLTGIAKLSAGFFATFSLWVFWHFGQGANWARVLIMAYFMLILLVITGLFGFSAYLMFTTPITGVPKHMIAFYITAFAVWVGSSLWLNALVVRFLSALAKVENVYSDFDMASWLQKNTFLTGLILGFSALLITLPDFWMTHQTGFLHSPTSHEMAGLPLTPAQAYPSLLCLRFFSLTAFSASALAFLTLVFFLLKAKGARVVVWSFKILAITFLANGLATVIPVLIYAPQIFEGQPGIANLAQFLSDYTLPALSCYWLADAFAFTFQPEKYLAEFPSRRIQL